MKERKSSLTYAQILAAKKAARATAKLLKRSLKNKAA